MSDFLEEKWFDFSTLGRSQRERMSTVYRLTSGMEFIRSDLMTLSKEDMLESTSYCQYMGLFPNISSRNLHARDNLQFRYQNKPDAREREKYKESIGRKESSKNFGKIR